MRFLICKGYFSLNDFLDFGACGTTDASFPTKNLILTRRPTACPDGHTSRPLASCSCFFSRNAVKLIHLVSSLIQFTC